MGNEIEIWEVSCDDIHGRVYGIKVRGKEYRAPSVTTVLKQSRHINDPNAKHEKKTLDGWQKRKDAREGQGSADRFAGRRSDIGTITHFKIISYLQQKFQLPITPMGNLRNKPTKAMWEKAELYFSYGHDWINEYNPRLIRGELNLFHPVLLYAGQADLLCEIGGKFYIVDIKTSRSVMHKYKAQVAAYQHAAWFDDRFIQWVRNRRRVNPWKWPWSKPDLDYINLAVLRVRDDGFQWKVIEPDWTLFFRCLMRYHRFHSGWKVHEDLDMPEVTEVVEWGNGTENSTGTV